MKGLPEPEVLPLVSILYRFGVGLVFPGQVEESSLSSRVLIAHHRAHGLDGVLFDRGHKAHQITLDRIPHSQIPYAYLSED